ncbi:gas vesicle protein [Streptomyces sp. NPDC051452]|uniref:gas vesicle protein n=1 Tax=Streptomyces sp. NPDC051452 TaxID=3365654 RepID=UPI0037B61A46
MTNAKNTSPSQSSRETRKTQDSEGSQESQESQESPGDTERHETGGRRPNPMEVLRHARAQLAELTGLTPESVSSFEQTEDGWSLEVEVLELTRVPDTMSLMAGYQVELDPEGQLTGYRRVRRYERGRADPRSGR